MINQFYHHRNGYKWVRPNRQFNGYDSTPYLMDTLIIIGTHTSVIYAMQNSFVYADIFSNTQKDYPALNAEDTANMTDYIWQDTDVPMLEYEVFEVPKSNKEAKLILLVQMEIMVSVYPENMTMLSHLNLIKSKWSKTKNLD